MKSFEVSPDQTAAIGQKLGVPLARLSNTNLIVQGSPIQVNLLDTRTESDARRLHRTISKMKGHPAFCLRVGKRVIEYVGKDPALATKTSYELGFLEKPKRIRYRITARVSPVERADYMSFNRLFNVFLATNPENPGKEAMSEIARLSKGFRFGDSLTMRSPKVGGSKAVYRFTPPARSKEQGHDETVTYRFNDVPEVLGVPYVTATMEISTAKDGLGPTPRKADQKHSAIRHSFKCEGR